MNPQTPADDDIEIRLFGKQGEFVICEERFTAFIGGIGSGKTFGGAVKAIPAMLPGTLGLVVAPTYRMLMDSTLRTCHELWAPWETAFNKSDMELTVSSGAGVLFRSADDPEKLRGPNLHWAWIDEGALCHAKTWDIVIGRLRAGGQAGPCWVTTTPKGRNWVWQRRDQMTLFRARTQDNPHLAPEYVTSLEQAYSGDFAKQELSGEFVMFEGLIYDEFSDAIHIQKRRRSEFQRVIVGVDEGHVNPMVALVLGCDSDNRLHALEEFYQRHVLQETFVGVCRDIATRHGQVEFVADPSAAGLIMALRASGLRVSEADNAVSDGIQEVKARLRVQIDGRPRLTVDPGCVNTVSEFESYVWAKSRDGTSKDAPEKQNDHAMDALRYACMAAKQRAPFLYTSV